MIGNAHRFKPMVKLDTADFDGSAMVPHGRLVRVFGKIGDSFGVLSGRLSIFPSPTLLPLLPRLRRWTLASASRWTAKSRLVVGLYRRGHQPPVHDHDLASDDDGTHLVFGLWKKVSVALRPALGRCRNAHLLGIDLAEVSCALEMSKTPCVEAFHSAFGRTFHWDAKRKRKHSLPQAGRRASGSSHIGVLGRQMKNLADLQCSAEQPGHRWRTIGAAIDIGAQNVPTVLARRAVLLPVKTAERGKAGQGGVTCFQNRGSCARINGPVSLKGRIWGSGRAIPRLEGDFR
ncbi:hypothetical protein [Sphingomonas oryzagri]